MAGGYRRTWWTALGLLLLGFTCPTLSRADEKCMEWAARLVSLQGLVEQRDPREVGWTKSQQDARLCPGDTLRTGANSRAAILLRNETLVRLDQLTTVIFPESGAQERNLLLDIIQGIGYFFSRTPKQLELKAPFVNAAVEGTELLLSAAREQSRLLVLDGVVRAHNAAGALRLTSGEGAVAGAGEAPRRIAVAKPRDAVEWALFYPPVIYFGDNDPGVPAGIRDAVNAFEFGDVTAALAILGQLPEGARTAGYYSLQASIFLYVGRVEEARTAIDQALQLDPKEGRALALQSIIALVLDDSEAAMRFAEKGATAQGQQGAASQIALSYLYQSRFELKQAVTHAETATRLAPGNPLAWARLAELRLAEGNPDKAWDAARTSITLSPRIARTQVTLGFVSLARFDAEQAATIFTRAIELDQADPLARLGLGISQIRQGKLAEGRSQIEIAASLDARSSIIRSYLGKAFFDEARDQRAATEYRIAEDLDPNDPTPWFYDAIRKQTENRPVEALKNLERSIELNDNRAVYRSSLLLDSDLAARSASQARIFGDLGFHRRALVEGWNSVNADPGNWSAHRLLADTYARRPRRNAARVSELFQSLMYQPINILPLQPQEQEFSLPIIVSSGPTDVALNEFNPLFARDGINLVFDGTLGNNDTWGNNLVLYGLLNRFSGSLGQFHYETSGFRENNDQRDDVYNAFVEIAVDPRLSLQAEYRHREAEQGDLTLNFDPDDFSQSHRREITQNLGRLGARIRATPSSELFLSAIAAARDESVGDEDEVFPTEIDGQASGMQGEAQYIFRAEKLNIITGGTYNDISEDSVLQLDLSSLFGDACPIFSPIPCTGSLDLDATHGLGYLYANVSMPTGFLWTLGISYENLDYHKLDFAKKRGYPKLGVQWELTDSLQVRAAYFETLKPILVVEETLQPTQVAGFTQFFDDSNATESTLYGFGADARVAENFLIGMEATHRNVEQPLFFPLTGNVSLLARDEDVFLAYAYWTPTDRWALSAQFEYEDVANDFTGFVGLGPDLVRTRSLPLQLRYFSPKGYFWGLAGTFVDQTVVNESSLPGQGEESFWVLGLELGYRLPQRLGFLSLEINNLLDQTFLYQDHNYLVTEPVPASYVPDRTIVGKISLSFDALFGVSAN